MNPCQTNNLTILRLLHGIFRKICHLNVALVMSCRSYYKKKIVTPFKYRLQLYTILLPNYNKVTFFSWVVQFDMIMNSTYKLVLVPSFNLDPQTPTFTFTLGVWECTLGLHPFQNCENIIYPQYHLTNLKVLHKA